VGRLLDFGGSPNKIVGGPLLHPSRRLEAILASLGVGFRCLEWWVRYSPAGWRSSEVSEVILRTNHRLRWPPTFVAFGAPLPLMRSPELSCTHKELLSVART
jgi:hypothetical protein